LLLLRFSNCESETPGFTGPERDVHPVNQRMPIMTG
jgi:hypothetical protein